MAKKMIQPEKSWFVKIPAKLTEIIRKAGLAGRNEYAYKGIYGDINEVFMMQEGSKPYIRKTEIQEAFKRGNKLRNKMFDVVLSNKWLFYSQEIEMGTDALIQPVFDMNTMTEKKRKDLVKAIEKQNYDKLQKLSPNVVAQYSKYSCCLFKEEEVNTDSSDSFHNSLSSAPARDGSEPIPENIPASRPASRPAGRPASRPASQDPIISTGANENKRIGEKENRDLNIEGRKDIGPLVGEAESEPSLPLYQKTELDVSTKQRSWEDYLSNLKVDSKEMQALLNYAGEDRPMIENNFELFKFHLLNRTKFRRKDECPLTASDAGKNEYIYTLLKNSSERRNLVKHIQESIEAKRKREFVQGRPGYPFDFYNKKGQRISGDRIVPDDAPPRPSDEHFWNGRFWNHR